MKKKVEKERRWLLRKVPNTIPDGALYEQILQYYTDDGWRYRATSSGLGDVEYIKIKKVPIENGINHELEITPITEDEFGKTLAENDAKGILKNRITFSENGYTFELDLFENITLTILEIEDVDIQEDIEFPDYIKREIIMEVTGNPLFSNYNLSSKKIKNEL